MAKIKLDGVVEAVHYSQDGQLVWARVYERRGPTFSDLVMLNRTELISRLKAGKKYLGGKRHSLLASTFDLYLPVTVVEQGGAEFLASGEGKQGQDFLTGIPVV